MEVIQMMNNKELDLDVLFDDTYKKFDSNAEGNEYIFNNKDNIKEAIKHMITEGYISNDERNILTMRYTHKMTYDKIGKEIDRDKETVRQKLEKIKRRIRKRIRNLYDPTEGGKIFNEMSTMLYNSLRRGGYDSDSKLYNIKHSQMVNVRNFGDKSWIELSNLLDKYNIPYIDDMPNHCIDSDLSTNFVSILKKIAKSESISIKKCYIEFEKNGEVYHLKFKEK
jgi:hypothetical protein